MVPVNELRSLKLVWCVPITDFDGWVKSKPEDVWTLLVRNRGEGGLTPLLKRRGLANGIEANVEEFTRAFVLLSVAIDLTPKGLAQWREVGGLVFGYLRRLSAAGDSTRLDSTRLDSTRLDSTRLDSTRLDLT